MIKDYNDVLKSARDRLTGICNVCPECDGRACAGKVPGCGSKGTGASFTSCRDYLKSIKINMDVIHANFDPNTKIEMFGHEFKYPFFVAPVGGMSLNYGGRLNEETYAKAVIDGAREAGICAWTGDGPKEEYFYAPLNFIRTAGGVAIPTIKPWAIDKIKQRIIELEQVQPMAFAMDIDSAALINLKLVGKPVYTKTVDDLKEIMSLTDIPFIAKGIMTPKAAERCAEAGCAGIVVSNHGGRVMEDAPAPASVLADIRKAVGWDMKIFVDGGIRSGGDVFKCLALGADAVLIGRPYVIAAHGVLSEGVKALTWKIASELQEAMLMTDCKDIISITKSKLKMK